MFAYGKIDTWKEIRIIAEFDTKASTAEQSMVFFFFFFSDGFLLDKAQHYESSLEVEKIFT